jgi:immunoglobulin-binding protein 1
LKNNLVVKNFKDPNEKHHEHKCTVINDQINKKLNVRNQVFRNANPTTLTLEEFGDRELERMREDEAKAAEYKLNKTNSDSEDEEVCDKKTQKARDWDDWKDENQKGGGNKMG